MMSSPRLSELEPLLRAERRGADPVIAGVSSDSRTITEGELFVALQGKQFDGHGFISQAAERGAAAALVGRFQNHALPQLKVDDTLQGLADLGRFNRAAFAGRLVAITGSNGKTSVKNLVQSVLSQRGSTLATRGNYNNEIGVPLTLLEISPGHEFAVIEMGAGKYGDIAYLCDIARPTISMVLNVMPAHLEGMGSLAGIAATKGEIYDGLGEADTAIINADQPWAADWRSRAAPAVMVEFGLNQGDVSAREIHTMGLGGSQFTLQTPEGDIDVRLQLPGKHSVINALAAASVGLVCGLTLEQIQSGLQGTEPVAGRLRLLQLPGGVEVIDDCYNANPGSVESAIDLLSNCKGQRYLVLGEMRELGEESETLHVGVGEYARQSGIEHLWGVGEALAPTVAAVGDVGRLFPDQDTLADTLHAALGQGDTVLIKGSRGAHMERVLERLLHQRGGT